MVNTMTKGPMLLLGVLTVVAILIGGGVFYSIFVQAPQQAIPEPAVTQQVAAATAAGLSEGDAATVRWRVYDLSDVSGSQVSTNLTVEETTSDDSRLAEDATITSTTD